MDKVSDILGAKILAEGNQCQFLNDFKQLQCDEDRIKFTLKIMDKYNAFPKATGMPKDAKESERLREQGNKIFVKGGSDSKLHIEALKMYSKSVSFAPYPSRQLALAYANRSAVLFKLALLSECIQDIDRALILDYPDDLKAKLYVRKVHCLILLENQSMEQTLEETLYWLEKMSLDKNKLKLQSKLDELLDKSTYGIHMESNIYSQYKSESKKLENEYINSIKSYNEEVPCASDAIAIKYNEQYGRHVVATRNIHPGEVIVVEKPYSLILMRDNMQTHCSNCLKLCWANIPCKYCSYTMYCSEKCRDIEWKKYHDIECDCFPPLIEYGAFNVDLFSVRLVLVAIREAGGILELRKLVEKADKDKDPRTSGFSEDGKLYSDRYVGIYNLVTNTENRKINYLFKKSVKSASMLYFLATHSTIFGAKLSKDFNILVNNSDVTFLGGLILRHQQIIHNNAHSYDEDHGEEFVQYGVAAMPFLSLINHSCDSNVSRVSIPEHIVLFATNPIKKGEQILDNYGHHYSLTPKSQRQENLFKQYCFVCDCIPCQEDWPLYDNLKSFETLVEDQNTQTKIMEAFMRFDTCLCILLKNDDINRHNTISDLIRNLKVLYDCVPMPCKEMSRAMEGLKKVYEMNGNRYVMPKLML